MMKVLLFGCALIACALASYDKPVVHKQVHEIIVHKQEGYKGDKTHVEVKKSVQIYHGKYNGEYHSFTHS